MSETKEIPAHIRLMAATHATTPDGPLQWAAFNLLASACAETDDLDHTSIVDEMICKAPVYAKAPELLAMLERVVTDIYGLIGDSNGVYGLHLNGDPAPWSEVMAGGEFGEWLESLSDAHAFLNQMQGESNE